MFIRLIRHGISEQQTGKVNATEIGDHRVSLDPSGIDDVLKLGESLGKECFLNSILYRSPYLRARNTLDVMLIGAEVDASQVKIYEDVRLREMEFGYAKNQEEIELEMKKREKYDYFYYRMEHGESPADVYDRVSSFLEGLFRQMHRKDHQNAIIVTHGITIRCFVMRWLHLTVSDYINMKNPKNCDVITIGPRDQIESPQFINGKWAVSGLRLYDRDNRNNICEECGKYPADYPGRLCPGCDAYKEHTNIY